MGKLRIMRIAGIGCYNRLVNFLRGNEDYYGKSYKQQQEILFSNYYVYGSGFSKGMQALGHDAIEIVADLEWLQKTWAKENNVIFNENNWKDEIILKQIEHFKPDILYFQDIHNLSFDRFKKLKENYSFIRKIIIFRGYPSLNSKLLRFFAYADIIFVGSPNFQKQLKEKNIDSHLIYHFFEIDIHQKINIKHIMPIYDFTFIGASGYGAEIEQMPRYAALLQLIRKSNIKLWIDEMNYEELCDQKWFFLKKAIKNFWFLKKLKYPEEYLRQVNQFYKDYDIKYVKKNELLYMRPLLRLYPHRCNHSVFGLDMYKLYVQSKITFNIHTLAAGRYADNMRLFQATGVGTCLLTEDSINLSDLFEKDNEIVTYSSIDECLDKVKYLLQNSKERQRIAQNGIERTLKDHTNIKRCSQMNEIIQDSLRRR